jgi:hypothetical protein
MEGHMAAKKIKQTSSSKVFNTKVVLSAKLKALQEGIGLMDVRTGHGLFELLALIRRFNVSVLADPALAAIINDFHATEVSGGKALGGILDLDLGKYEAGLKARVRSTATGNNVTLATTFPSDAVPEEETPAG